MDLEEDIERTTQAEDDKANTRVIKSEIVAKYQIIVTRVIPKQCHEIYKLFLFGSVVLNVPRCPNELMVDVIKS